MSNSIHDFHGNFRNCGLMKSEAKKTKGKGKDPKKSSSEAGKGDKLRRGISQNVWEEKWKRIFGEKECD